MQKNKFINKYMFKQHVMFFMPRGRQQKVQITTFNFQEELDISSENLLIKYLVIS